MTFKSILVHVSRPAESAVRCAADLADRYGALLIGCGSQAMPAWPAEPVATTDATLVTALTDAGDQRLEREQTAFERLAGSRPHAWIASRTSPDEAMAQAARGADLIVACTDPGTRGETSRCEDAGLLVVVCGRPVLLAPLGRDYLAADRVVVCWKDRREANRAVTDALPFLRRAKSVLVIEAAQPLEMPAASQRIGDVAALLRRHGVEAEAEVLPKDERRTATILLDRTSAFGADLVVAGGYGRSRLGEWAFGGVTRALLEQGEHFALLSH